MEVVHDFGERLSSERVGTTAPDGTLTGSGPHPFGRETVVALGHDRVYLGSEESYEIEVYDLTGAPLEPIRWSGPALDYDHDLIDRLTEAAIDRAPERSRRAVRTWYRDLPELDQVPAYDRIVVSDQGQVWVRQFVRPGSSGVTWVIFSHAQELIGQLTLPPRSTLWEVRGDRVVYSTPDEYDVPVVRISRVERAGGPGGGSRCLDIGRTAGSGGGHGLAFRRWWRHVPRARPGPWRTPTSIPPNVLRWCKRTRRMPV